MHQYKPSKTVSRILFCGAVLFVASAFFNAALGYRWASSQNFVCIFCHEKMSKVRNERGQAAVNLTSQKCPNSRRHGWLRLPESSELNVFDRPISVQTN